MRKTLDSTSTNTKFRRQSLRLNAKDFQERKWRKRKSRGSFTCKQTKKEEKSKARKGHITGHKPGPQRVFTITRKPAKKTARAGKKK
jgi:hypothetical protein